MSNMIHILTELWCKPTLIVPEMHKQICQIVHDHMTGQAHAEGGCAGLFDAVEDSATTMEIVDGVAVVPINGVIDKRANAMAKQSGATSLDEMEAMLASALLDESVQGIFLDVNSPGGSVTGVPEMAKKIAAAATVKPMVAYTDTMMASAAYWLSAGASALYASESANVGSIGVYMAFLDTSRAYEMAGLRTELFKAGKHKAAGIDGIALTDEQRERIQADIDTIYDWFRGFVTKHRPGVPQAAMEGQTFFGADALAMDLVDNVGTPEDAMAELRGMIEAQNDETIG